MVRKEGGKYVVKSADGKKTLSKGYDTRAAAVHRLQQIEYFKHADQVKKAGK